ncbi:MAG TPA: GntR family transcriptional regulator [Candidatus Baltobacteraceae bacterium]|nr:GntR family transcriptional regulator [Candidatus Baltobacteraceae bacterium]
MSVHATIEDRIAEGLRERILSGKLRPGERLRQAEIAEQFSASHIPVREALRRLNAEGLVSIESRRGAVVSQLSQRELEEIIRLRQLLEVELLTQAIPKMTDEDFARSRKALAALTSNRRGGSYSAHNWAFHEALYHASGAPLTLSLVERLHRIGERYFELKHDLDEVNAEHGALLDLTKKRDVKRAAELLYKHIGRLSERIPISTPTNPKGKTPAVKTRR